eukprot:1149862-Pelagomonas_calceolata.AAC.2
MASAYQDCMETPVSVEHQGSEIRTQAKGANNRLAKFIRSTHALLYAPTHLRTLGAQRRMHARPQPAVALAVHTHAAQLVCSGHVIGGIHGRKGVVALH